MTIAAVDRSVSDLLFVLIASTVAHNILCALMVLLQCMLDCEMIVVA
jgi:hypothetical protein